MRSGARRRAVAAAAAGLVLLCGSFTARADRLRVWLLAPAGPGAQALLPLLRAELGSQGFVVDERPLRAPGETWERAVAEARAAGAFAVVAPAAGERAAADVLLLAPAGEADRHHALDLGMLTSDRGRPPPGLAAVLAVRVSELLRARASERGAFGRAPRPSGTTSPAAPAPRPTGAAIAAPAAPPLGEARLRLELAAIAGWPSAATGATGGAGLAASWQGGNGVVVGAAVLTFPFARAQPVPGGSARLLQAAAFAELGYELRWARGRLAPAAALGLGAQYTLARGRAAHGDFIATSQGTWSPAAVLGASLGIRLALRLWLVVGARGFYRWRPPELWGDAGRVARVPALSAAGWVGLRVGLY